MDLEFCISVSVQRQLFCDMQFGLITMALCMPKNNYLASTLALSEAVTVSFKNTRTLEDQNPANDLILQEVKPTDLTRDYGSSLRNSFHSESALI